MNVHGKNKPSCDCEWEKIKRDLKCNDQEEDDD